MFHFSPLFPDFPPNSARLVQLLYRLVQIFNPSVPVFVPRFFLMPYRFFGPWYKNTDFFQKGVSLSARTRRARCTAHHTGRCQRTHPIQNIIVFLYQYIFIYGLGLVPTAFSPRKSGTKIGTTWYRNLRNCTTLIHIYLTYQQKTVRACGFDGGDPNADRRDLCALFLRAPA